MDDFTKHSHQIPNISQLGILAHSNNNHTNNRTQFSVPFSTSPFINMKGCEDFIEKLDLVCEKNVEESEKLSELT